MIMCLDYGSRYIGIAITDADERLAVRYGIIDQKQQAALPEIERLVATEQIITMLVGVPISLSGRESAQTRITREFIAQLQVAWPNLIILEVDETLTSFEAERRIKSEGGKISEAHAEAARIMLEDYLRSH